LGTAGHLQQGRAGFCRTTTRLKSNTLARLARFGLLTGAVQPGSLGEKDERLRHPRFSAENLPKNLELAQAVQKVASDRGCTAGQVSLAWLLAQGEDIIPIPGTKTLSRLIENIDAAGIILSDAEIGFIASSIPPDAAAGLRYRAEHMKNMYL
jgi:aryl-alcohol dehydrogenase-like predicted oxidoreductase